MSQDPYEKIPYKQKKMEYERNEEEEDEDEDDEEYYDKKHTQFLENLNSHEIEALIDQQAQKEDLAFDEGILIKLISQLAIKKKKNEEMRAQFSSKPEKFEESEVDLDGIIRQFNSISAYPGLVKVFTESSALTNLIELLYHENTDIVNDTIDFFHEVFTMEVDETYLSSLLQLYLKAVKGKFFEAITGNLQRLDEKQKDGYEAVHKLLGKKDQIICCELEKAINRMRKLYFKIYDIPFYLICKGILEGMLEMKPEFIKDLVEDTHFLKWTLSRIHPEFSLPGRVIDDNILYLSEILPIILTNEASQIIFTKIKGIDSLLSFLKKYEKKDPTCEEEKETLLNLADCLCLLLVKKVHQDTFLSSGGIELMLKLISSKGLSSKIALRVLNYALVNHQENCLKFVDSQGLKYAFPILVQKGIKSKKPDEIQKIDEQITSIIKNILKETSAVQQDRVINKFKEDIAKIDRLFELHKIYQKNMVLIENQISNPAYLKNLEEFETDNIQEAIYQKKLEAGLSILENVDFIISYLNQCSDKAVSSKVEKNIQAQNTKAELISILSSNLNYLDDSAEKDKQFLRKLISLI